MTLHFTANARRQLDSIYSFYEEKNPKAAACLYNDILDEVEQLLIFPKMAAVEQLLSDYSEEFRSLVVRKNYKVIYFVHEETAEIIIVAVWDCRQNPETLKNTIK